MSVALFIVHWPGKDTPACLDHTTKLQHLAGVLGMALSMTPVDPLDGEVFCKNCENEVKHGKREAATNAS